MFVLGCRYTIIYQNTSGLVYIEVGWDEDDGGSSSQMAKSETRLVCGHPDLGSGSWSESGSESGSESRSVSGSGSEFESESE